MADGMYTTGKKYDRRKVFKDNMDKWEDCRETNTAKVQSAHFTLCQKPYNCRRSSI